LTYLPIDQASLFVMLKNNPLQTEWMQFAQPMIAKNFIDFIRVSPFKFLNNIYYQTIN